MIDPVVQAAFVVIVAWLLKFLFAWLNFPIDEATLNTIAAGIVSWLLGLFFLRATARLLPGAVRKGILKGD